MNRKLEICCYSLESALLAQDAGAHRIELCDNYYDGGTTPSYATIAMAIERLSIPVNVIIRPRGGDFLYSGTEFESVIKDVVTVKQLKANGVVVGFLKPDGEIDLDRTSEIVRLASPLEVTFHRAFDMCRDSLEALEQLKRIGVKRILTSGGRMKAIDGIELISALVKKAKDEIIIMPGSGVNETNLTYIKDKTGAVEFHSSAKTFVKSKMNYFNEAVSMGGNSAVDEFKVVSVNTDSISKMVEILK